MIKILPLILISLLFTACEIPEMCFHGDKIGYNETNEGHGFLRIWNCKEDTPINTTETIYKNITIENYTIPQETEGSIPVIDLTKNESN